MNSQNSTATDILLAPRLRPEWEQQSAVLIAWPHEGTDWRDILQVAEECYVQLCTAITRFQDVLICVKDPAHKTHVTQMLTAAGIDAARIKFAIVSYNDTWTRDYGPISINTESGPRMLDFQFNGWGGRFDAALDNQVTTQLQRQGWFGDNPIERVPLVLEGGAIDTNGAEVLLTTTSCVLNPNRNGPVDKGLVEPWLRQYLGLPKVCWLEHGMLVGDDTDGHVDQLARFCNADTIVFCADYGDDEQAHSLRRMESELRHFNQANGGIYQLVPLPVPQPIDNQQGDRLPASYVNFLIVNDAVLVPRYDDPADDIACKNLSGCFPDRDLVTVPARALIEQGGSLHCATMQLAAGLLALTKDTMLT